MGYGFSGHVGIAKEAVWSTAVGATDYMKAFSESLMLSLDRFEVENIIGAYAQPDDVAGVQRIMGDLVIPAHPQATGYLLKGVFGQSSISVVASGALWRTAFTSQGSDTAANNALPSYTLETFRDVTSSQQYDGVLFSRLGFSIAPNNVLQLTAGLIGRQTRNIAKTTPTFTTSPTYPFTFDTCSFSIGGAASADIEAFALTLDNQLQGIPVLDASKIVVAILRGGSPNLTFSATLRFQNITEYQNFVNQTEQRMFLNFTKANSFNLLLDFPRIVYTTYPLGMPGRERLTVGMEGKGFYHQGSATQFMAELTTTKSNY